MFSLMWNLKNKSNKTTLIDTENRKMVARGEDIGGWAKQGKRLELQTSNYKINWLWGYNRYPDDYGQ